MQANEWKYKIYSDQTPFYAKIELLNWLRKSVQEP